MNKTPFVSKEKIEEIVNSYEGIKQSFAVQAGREVRVIVQSEMFDDLAEMLKPIMEDIKKSATVLDDRIKEKYSVNNDGVLKDE